MDPTTPYVPKLKGTGLEIFAVSIVGGILATLTVLLRTWGRVSSSTFGLDDALMLGGLVIYITDVGLACEGARAGLGTLDDELSAKMQIDSRMWLMIWMMLYTCGLCLIKSSICVTMLRIAQTMRYFRFAVYTLLIITVATWITTFVGILLLCRPVEANWNASLVMSASTILTDMACAVLPAFLLWKMQMALKNKILVGILLSFASFASISTMIRTPFIEYYRDPLNNLPYHIGNIVLWSNVETGIGLIAGSLPSLRLLIIRSRKMQDANSGQSAGADELVTFGSTPVPGSKGHRSKGRSYRSPTETGLSTTTIYARGEGDWRRLHDSNSVQGEEAHARNLSQGIRADFSYKVEHSDTSKHTGRAL